MAIRLIGKKSPYTGYMLFEILNQLKNYGLGRVIGRNSYKKFPELCFYIIRDVIPMREMIGPNEVMYGKVWVDEVFRGRKLEGLKLLKDETYLPDFYLIPRHEEDEYLNYKSKDIVKILPKYMEPPPVISELIKEKNPNMESKPKIEVLYKDLSEQFLYKVAEEGTTPDHKIKVELPEKFKIGIKY